MNLRIYCINLKSRPDRWERFSKQPGLAKFTEKFPFERVEGVDGKKIDIANDSRVSVRTRRNILFSKRRDHEDLDTAGGVGCYLSHYSVWTKFSQSPDDACLIFEDDAYITPTLFDELQTAWADLGSLGDKQPDVWVLSHKFGTRLSDILGTDSSEKMGVWETNVHAPNTAYIVFKRGVQKLIDNALPVDGHLDHYMYRLAQLGIITHVHHDKVNVFQYSLGNPFFRDSDIQEKSNCDICDIPDNPVKQGYFILTNQNKLSLAIVAAGLCTLYFLKEKMK
jgi:GR25 family glycosyltransferase involved in LPS biosynthesis